MTCDQSVGGNAGNGPGVRTCTSVLRLLVCCSLQFDASKKEIDPNLLPRKPFRPRKKKSKEANLCTSTSEAEDEVLTALSMADDLGKKVNMHDFKQIAKARQY